MATYSQIEHLYMDKVTYLEELLVVLNYVQINFVCYFRICVNKVIVWLWSWRHAQIHGGGCDIVLPIRQVWWAKWVPLRAIIGIFCKFLQNVLVTCAKCGILCNIIS